MSGVPSFPRVSIVTPAYNQADFLAETIESVLAQDYPNIEYIVLDDGSTDSTPEVLKRYTGKVHWERHDNMGQARTLNKGWAMSQGELIGYLSSDDVLRPDAISKLAEALLTAPDAVVAYGDFDLIDAHGDPLRTIRAEDFNLRRLTVDLICQPGAGVLFRKTAFEQTGGWQPRLHQVPDFDFWLRVAHYGRFVHVPRVLAAYRVHDDSGSFRTVSSARSMEIVQAVEAYWAPAKASPERRLAMASAYTLAARSHAQSRRFGAALHCAAIAIKFNRRLVLHHRFWRSMFAGVLRRFIYKLRFQTRPDSQT